MNSAELRQRIACAKDQIGIAEGELDEVLRAMRISPGNEKVTISDAAADSFEKLRAAKACLVSLEALLGRDEEGGDP